MWISNGVFTNPAANTVLADSGPVSGGGDPPLPTIWISSTVAAIVLLQHRDSTNTTNLHQHAFPVPANGNLVIPSLGNVQAAPGERLRAILNAAIVGQIQVSFFG